MLAVMSKIMQIRTFFILMLLLSACSSEPKITAERNVCRYEITPENYKKERKDCSGFIRQVNYEKLVSLRNRDALEEAKALQEPYDKIIAAALNNKMPGGYCLSVFGDPPSDSLISSLEAKDKLLDCSEKRIPRVSVSNITESEGRFVVYVVFDCGLNGRCQSAWEIYVRKSDTGDFYKSGEKLDWIT